MPAVCHTSEPKGYSGGAVTEYLLSGPLQEMLVNLWENLFKQFPTYKDVVWRLIFFFGYYKWSCHDYHGLWTLIHSSRYILRFDSWIKRYECLQGPDTYNQTAFQQFKHFTPSSTYGVWRPVFEQATSPVPLYGWKQTSKKLPRSPLTILQAENGVSLISICDYTYIYVMDSKKLLNWVSKTLIREDSKDTGPWRH